MSAPISPAPSGDAGEPSDDELARRVLGDPAHEDGEAFLLMYARYRDVARAAMQSAGLALDDAERRVGGVFDRFLDRRAEYPTGRPLRAWLEQIAREVAESAHRAPEKRESESLPSRIGSDGFFGSGMW